MAQRSQISKQRTMIKDPSSNRSFFANIKSELSNIKNDVNKLVKKQGQQDPKKICNPQTQQIDNKKKIAEEKYQNGFQNDDEKKQLKQKIIHLEKQVTSQRQKMGQIINKFEEQRSQFEAYQKVAEKTQKSHLTEKEHLKDRLIQLTKIIQQQQTNRKCAELNTFGNEQIKTIHEQYQQKLKKLQHTLKSETESKDQILQQNKTIKATVQHLQKKSEILAIQNQRLKEQIEQIRKNNKVEIEKLLNTDHQENQISYEKLGESFQKKINTLIQQNYQLKNRCSWFESKVQELEMKNKFNQETILAYEQRDRDNSSPSEFQQQISDLIQKIQEMKDQKDQLISNHELEIMKLQNQIDDLKHSKNSNSNTTMNQILKDQITEIEHLRKKIKDKENQIIKMKQRR